MKKVIVTAKNNPDLDGVASAIAYTYFLNTHTWKKQYFVAFGGQAQFEALYVLKLLWLQKADRNLDTVRFPKTKKFILVDYSEKHWISEHIIPENVIEVINHKNAPLYDDFPHAKFRIEYVGAAATLIAEEFFFQQHVEIPQKIVDLLYCAIYSNSMNYGTKMTWFRDLRMKEWLEQKWANKNLPIQMIKAKTDYAKKHLKHMFHADGKLMLLDNWLLVDLLQLEIGDGERFLKNISLIEETIRTLHTEQQVLCLLHLHDIEKKKTYLLSNYEHFLRYISQQPRCTGMHHGSYIEFSELFIRKDTWPLLANLLKKIDNSYLLQDFLK